MRYAWHPWHEQLLEVRTADRYRGVVRCFLAGDERVAKLLPEWMLDEAVCAGMRIAESGSVSVAALDALASLLAEAASVDATARLTESTAHEPATAKDEEGTAARSDGATGGDPALVHAAGELPTRDCLAAGDHVSKRGGWRRGGGR